MQLENFGRKTYAKPKQLRKAFALSYKFNNRALLRRRGLSAFPYKMVYHLYGKENLRKIILAVCYTCLPFALIALFSLRQLLKNIMRGETFVHDNIKQLDLLFICCALAAVITFFSGYFYLPFYIISVAAAFFSLILRVIKNVFRSAIEIKSENELTI